MDDSAGQVGVITTSPGPYGRQVQRFTRSPAFHVVTRISDTECVSAQMPEVVVRPVSHYPKAFWITPPFPDEKRRRASVLFALDQVGKPYAYLDILLLFIAIELKERTPLVIQDQLQNTRQWFCSELADVALRVGGVKLFPGRPAAAVMPKDFLRLARQPQSIFATT